MVDWGAAYGQRGNRRHSPRIPMHKDDTLVNRLYWIEVGLDDLDRQVPKGLDFATALLTGSNRCGVPKRDIMAMYGRFETATKRQIVLYDKQQ